MSIHMKKELETLISNIYSIFSDILAPIIIGRQILNIKESDESLFDEVISTLKVISQNVLKLNASSTQNALLFIEIYKNLEDDDKNPFQFSEEINIDFAKNLLESCKKLVGYEPENFHPLEIVALAAYDFTHGTTHADLYSHLLTSFALLCAKNDGEISDSEKEYLLKFNSSLHDAVDLGKEVARKKKNSTTNQELNKIQHQDNLLKDSSQPYKSESLETLKSLIGIDEVKSEIARILNSVKISKIREERGLPATSGISHFVFHGNPGTGKTTVARLLASALRDIGALSKGQLIEVDRSGVVAGYVGQTAEKTRQIVESAIGGVLFIDEAYTLSKEGNDFGQEAIDTLLKMMEDHRENLVVVAAGYTDKMKEFIDSNPGLASRFQKHIFFEDYTPAELFQIFTKMVSDAKMILSENAIIKIKDILEKAYMNRDNSFGNARMVRNIFHKSIGMQADRLVTIENITEEDLQTLTADDINIDY